jgi:hypothetical protein
MPVALKSGGGVLCVAIAQLVVGIILLGIYEAYKVRGPPVRPSLFQPSFDVFRVFFSFLRLVI